MLIKSQSEVCPHTRRSVHFQPSRFTSIRAQTHPRGEEKGSGYNTTSRPTLEGRNQHTIVSDHVLTYAILSMPRGPHCGAYYSNCAVIGHFTCQTAYVTGSDGISYCNQTFFSGRMGSGHETNLPDSPFWFFEGLVPRLIARLGILAYPVSS